MQPSPIEKLISSHGVQGAIDHFWDEAILAVGRGDIDDVLDALAQLRELSERYPERIPVSHLEPIERTIERLVSPPGRDR